ncbi:hypothetical protein K144313037_p20450 (plasmid) [Clostridium tetani]|uniref:siphovirus Gp157 family protein n=1 Tax=Clostridium tetani TaxID=1513 RepID=UPI0029544E6E|nr:siphovirus Gp157 family protein [Clostridium tetani]BDR71258.1 hypothetical protein K144313037_p20450 [Clostridium tetani]BEV19059.1 siphovirus Gp157 family protein [Clostridium tetani]
MAKLYELTEQYSNLMELLDNPEVPQEMLEESLNKINDELDVKLENVAKLIKSIEVDVKGFKEEEKRLADRRKSSENRITNLKEYVEGAMRATGIKKVNGKVFTLGIQKNAPSVDITDENSIPEEYFILEKRLVKKKVLEAHKEGRKVPGTTIKRTESLRIR